jgi:hypothetical protein
MSKKGRIKAEDQAILNGLADGVVTKGNYTREKKGTKVIHTFSNWKMIFDYSITKNGPISIENMS